MKNLEVLFDEALEIVKDCIGEDKIEYIYRPITINSRATRRWGMCTSSPDGRHRIQIAKKLLADDVSYEATMNTVIHEILHACKDGGDHKGAWKNYANKVNSKYPQFNIKRTTSNEEKGIEPSIGKYAVKCTCCGNTYYRTRMAKVIKYPQLYRCGTCRGTLERVA